MGNPDRVARHRRAAATHERSAECHGAAAAFWADHDDGTRAELERRNARIERDAADLERDRAEIEAAQPGDAG